MFKPQLPSSARSSAKLQVQSWQRRYGPEGKKASTLVISRLQSAGTSPNQPGCAFPRTKKKPSILCPAPNLKAPMLLPHPHFPSRTVVFNQTKENMKETAVLISSYLLPSANRRHSIVNCQSEASPRPLSLKCLADITRQH